MPTTTETTTLRGGEWLIQPSAADAVFTPERLTDEHRLIGRTAQAFVEQEVLPKLDQLETKDWALARELVKVGASLGLLGVDVPEDYGGLGLDKVTSLVVSEKLAAAASFGATCGAASPLVEANGPVMVCLTPVGKPAAGGFLFVNGIRNREYEANAYRYIKDKGVRKLALPQTTDETGNDAEADAQEALKYPDLQAMQIVDNDRHRCLEVL